MLAILHIVCMQTWGQRPFPATRTSRKGSANLQQRVCGLGVSWVWMDPFTDDPVKSSTQRILPFCLMPNLLLIGEVDGITSRSNGPSAKPLCTSSNVCCHTELLTSSSSDIMALCCTNGLSPLAIEFSSSSVMVEGENFVGHNPHGGIFPVNFVPLTSSFLLPPCWFSCQTPRAQLLSTQYYLN